jgi:hypothetical protein
MSEQRQVTIFMNAAQQTLMRDATDTDEWHRAVGRLASWNMSYPTCNIYTDGETDMVAVYLNEQGERGYVIGAVWHDDHYGFHS